MLPLIYGTAWKKERTADLVEMAILAGFRGIDTACQPKHYHEAGVGEALGRLALLGIKREDIFIQTKFTPLGGHDPQRIPYDPNAPFAIQVAQSFVVSQHNLGTHYVDSLVLHSPLYPMRDLMSVWSAMETLYHSGNALQLGISNCYDLEVLQRLYRDAEVKPTVLQNRFYRESDYDNEIREWCSAHNIHYQSFWSLSANPHILAHPLLIGLAKKLASTEAQIWYRYLNQVGITPLIGSTSKQHLLEDLDIFSFVLSEEEISLIGTLLKPI